jgi:osmotically-inducible protein OsmY
VPDDAPPERRRARLSYDESILDDVCERIARSGIDADGLEVNVENGEVTISGIVASRVDKWRLEVIADDVFGVEEVHDQVRVARTPPGERVAGPAEDRLRH